jgi:hypothetical protein
LHRDAKVNSAVWRERKRLRIAELAADPANRKYASMMERGGYWTDAQIAYAENRDITAVCQHLKPVESAMRHAGIATHLLTESIDKSFAPLPAITADCRLDWKTLRRTLVLAEPVRYEEGYQPERHERDNPWARLACSNCKSKIDLVHPEGPGAGIPWFPAPPELSV